MRKPFCLFVGLMIGATILAPSAFSFGTVRILGQNAEHERITRRALACAAEEASDECFQRQGLSDLAGGSGTFGAVGIPDRGKMVFQAQAHCDGGDYLAVEAYPQTAEEAQRALERCRSWMLQQLSEAVTAAAPLVDSQGQIDLRQVAKAPCNFVGQVRGRAKCNVLERFGILLHAAQDFYSHSNWNDADDASVAVGPQNPPGLKQPGRSNWLDLRAAAPQFPAGLITGCFETGSAASEEAFCNYGPDGETPRIKHLALNKDTGKIDPAIGPGTTRRGAVNDNFKRAVEAAISDTKDKWLTLRERLIETYGGQKGRKMICAITRDHPEKDC